jgi:hypothetical protein
VSAGGHAVEIAGGSFTSLGRTAGNRDVQMCEDAHEEQSKSIGNAENEYCRVKDLLLVPASQGKKKSTHNGGSKRIFQVGLGRSMNNRYEKSKDSSFSLSFSIIAW